MPEMISNKIPGPASVATICCLLMAGCASLSYDQLPGPTHTQKTTLPAPAQRVCAAVPAAAAEAGLRAASAQTTPGGCIVDVRRDSPWWLPGDDGERLRVEVMAGAASASGDDSSDVTVTSKRVAPGQIWLDRSDQALLSRLAAKAGRSS